MLLASNAGVCSFHPAELPGPGVDGIPPFAVDFLLDTTRAAYLLVRNGICRRYPQIKFILSHAGGFVPYASHRMAVTIMGDTGRSLTDILDDFTDFYFDTALSSSAAALPSLLAFAKPGHVTFGSDWPFAPVAAGKLFAAGLEPIPDSAPTPARRSSAPMRSGSSPVSGRRHLRPPGQRSIRCVTRSAEPSCAASRD